MTNTSINIYYVAPSVLIDTNAGNRTISLVKDSTLITPFKTKEKRQKKTKETSFTSLLNRQKQRAKVTEINYKPRVPVLPLVHIHQQQPKIYKRSCYTSVQIMQ